MSSPKYSRAAESLFNAETFPTLSRECHTGEKGDATTATLHKPKKHHHNMSLNLFEAHSQWATRPSDERFQTLEALTDSVRARKMKSRSQDGEVQLMKIIGTEDGEIHVNGQHSETRPSHWAFGQLSTVLGAPAGYLRTLPAPLAAECLRDGIKRTEKTSLKFLSLANDETDTNTLQAVTSPTYGRIWDHDVATLAQRIVDHTDGRFHNPLAYNVPGQLGGTASPSGLYASDRDVFIFMIDGGSLLEAGPRAQINRGFFLKNSEVGAATFSLTTFLFNMVCGNHIVWGAQDVNEFSVRHTKNGPYRFDGEALPRLLAYADASAKPLEDALRRAQDFNLAQSLGLNAGQKLTQDDVQTFLAKNVKAKFTRSEVKEAMQFAEREEGKCASLWDLAQGFTAYARGFDWIDARADLETRAGKLLDIVKEA